MSSIKLISLAEASRVSERSDRTIRRWIGRAKLTRHEGDPPGHGGPAPVLVDKNELMILLASSGQQPSLRGDSSPSPEAPDTMTPPTPGTTRTHLDSTIKIIELEAQLSTAELRAELVQVTTERDALRLQVDGHNATLARLATHLNQMRDDLKDWRDRHDAKEAELRALRSSSGIPWWRRLVGGPVAALENG